MKLIIPILSVILFISCTEEKPKTDSPSPTKKILTKLDNEKTSAQAIVDFYGGEIEVSPGVFMNEGKNEKYVQIELRKSELIESYIDMIDIPASNIAYLFYAGLQSKAIEYDFIKVLIATENGTQKMFNFYIKNITDVPEYIEILNKTSNLLRDKNAAGLHSLFNPEIGKELSEATLKQYINSQDSIYGAISETQFQGFSKFETEDDNQQVIQLYGIMIRSKENCPICVFIDRETKEVLTIEDSF